MSKKTSSPAKSLNNLKPNLNASSLHPVQPSQQEQEPVFTVLKALGGVMTKRYYHDESTGEIKKDDYSNISHFTALPGVGPKNIRALGNAITALSKASQACIIRGLHPSGEKQELIQRRKVNFPEHSEGTPWVMLDIDGIIPPKGMSDLSPEAIRWLIDKKLPEPFRNVTCFYQFSSSAGILGADGQPLKKGLRVHLFFILNRRIPGSLLTAYLMEHCLDTGFFELKRNQGGVPMLQYGIDMAPIRSSVQVHYTAAPILGDGVRCVLKQDERQGFIEHQANEVVIPALNPKLEIEVRNQHAAVLAQYKRSLGYVRKAHTTQTRTGFAVTEYYARPDEESEVRTGRKLRRYEIQRQICRLFFEDENTPGSWYVPKRVPQMAYRFGDGASCPLIELSADAYRMVREELRWFVDIPTRNLNLEDTGFLPSIDSFASARHSLVLAPTGSGKTTRVIDWMQARSTQAPVIYTAPTIPLVNQMAEDLKAREVRYKYYRDISPGYVPQTGIIVTTNQSLQKILGYLAEGYGQKVCLVFDEIHMGLDEFCESNHLLKRFQDSIQRAERCLYLTGTLTDTQKHMLAQQVADLDKSILTENKYCVYDFAAIKQNPLRLLPLDNYGSDIIEFFEEAKKAVESGCPIDRSVIMTDSSRMKAFEIMVEGFGLQDHVSIVSRPETTPDDIEDARRGAKPILICSPLFAVGLNFVWEPKRLWCRFTYIKADTSRIIQSINRANRGSILCDVRIYANPDSVASAEPIRYTPSDDLRQELENIFSQELDLPVGAEADVPMLLDRNTYKDHRMSERHSNEALKQLMDGNGFQNYVFEDFEAAASDKDRAESFKKSRKEARSTYDDLVTRSHEKLLKSPFPMDVLYFEEFSRERRKRQWAQDPEPQRVDREIEADELATVVSLCDTCSPQEARAVNLHKLRTLLGARNPWLSNNFDQSINRNTAAAEKIDKILPLLQVLDRLRTGGLTGKQLASGLVNSKPMEVNRPGF